MNSLTLIGARECFHMVNLLISSFIVRILFLSFSNVLSYSSCSDFQEKYLKKPKTEYSKAKTAKNHHLTSKNTKKPKAKNMYNQSSVVFVGGVLRLIIAYPGLLRYVLRRAHFMILSDIQRSCVPLTPRSGRNWVSW